MADKELVVRAPHLISKDFGEAAFKRTEYAIDVPIGVPVEALLDPAYWANKASVLRPNDRIEASPQDSSWLAIFSVRSAGPNWAHVERIFYHEFVSVESVVAKASKTHEIKWGNPLTKFRVFRLSDNTVAKDGFQTKEEATEWLAANMKAIA